jgi:hypothetical protein
MAIPEHRSIRTLRSSQCSNTCLPMSVPVDFDEVNLLEAQFFFSPDVYIVDDLPEASVNDDDDVDDDDDDHHHDNNEGGDCMGKEI